MFVGERWRRRKGGRGRYLVTSSSLAQEQPHLRCPGLGHIVALSRRGGKGRKGAKRGHAVVVVSLCHCQGGEGEGGHSVINLKEKSEGSGLLSSLCRHHHDMKGRERGRGKGRASCPYPHPRRGRVVASSLRLKGEGEGQGQGVLVLVMSSCCVVVSHHPRSHRCIPVSSP